MDAASTEYPNLDPVVANKILTAKQKKDSADQAFKTGHLQPALRSYHEVIFLSDAEDGPCCLLITIWC